MASMSAVMSIFLLRLFVSACRVFSACLFGVRRRVMLARSGSCQLAYLASAARVMMKRVVIAIVLVGVRMVVSVCFFLVGW